MGRYLILISFLIFTAAVAFSQSEVQNKDLADIVATERAFAALAVKERWQTAFIAYFADDGIGFGPHPERTKEVLEKRGIPTAPRTIVFNWAPQFGDISAAGDMGYSTGPVLFTDVTANPKPPTHGIYFSVWQKQADGTWKVAIDIGADTPQAVAPIDTKFTPAEPVKRTGDTAQTAVDYRQLDWTFWGSIAKTSPARAYNARLDKQFRVHRKGVMPITDRKDLAPVLAQTKFEFIDGKLAASKDFAFTYGKYTTVNDARGTGTGYYVHVWRRDAQGTWKLVVDVQHPLPKTDK